MDTTIWLADWKLLALIKVPTSFLYNLKQPASPKQSSNIQIKAKSDEKQIMSP